MKTAAKVFLIFWVLVGAFSLVVGVMGSFYQPLAERLAEIGLPSIVFIAYGIVAVPIAYFAYYRLCDSESRKERVAMGVLAMIFCGFFGGLFMILAKDETPEAVEKRALAKARKEAAKAEKAARKANSSQANEQTAAAETQREAKSEESDYPYVIEMLNIRKEFPGIVANDDITLQLKRGEIHALLGENGAGKSTLMSVLFGLYQPEKGEIRKNGKVVKINDPNDATALGIGMVHQHFKLVEVFSVLDNIILGAETTKMGFLQKKQARQKVMALSEKYGLNIDPKAKVEDITVGMQQRTEILKMLYRDNEILIFDEPTAVLTPQEIDELMGIMKGLAAEGKSILFITHKLNEIMAVADRVTVLRKGKYIGTVETKNTTTQQLSEMMVGRPVQLKVDKDDAKPGETVLEINNLCVKNKLHKKDAVHNVSLQVREGEIVCIAGIDGNGQTEFGQALTGLEKVESGTIKLCGEDITHKSIRYRNTHGVSHIPEDRHKHGLVLDYTLEQNLILQRYFEPGFQTAGFINFKAVRRNAETLIEKYDVRSGQGPVTIARSMSGGNQQKAIVAREMEREHKLLVAIQPTRGLDVGAIEYIHSQIVKLRDSGSAVLLISLELDEVMNLSDRILVMYEGEIVGELDPKKTNVQELGLYMAGAKRDEISNKGAADQH